MEAQEIKFNQVKDDFMSWEENYNLLPTEIEWMIEEIERLRAIEQEYEALKKGL